MHLAIWLLAVWAGIGALCYLLLQWLDRLTNHELHDGKLSVSDTPVKNFFLALLLGPIVIIIVIGAVKAVLNAADDEDDDGR
jgi:uncharacterized membrane protein YdjX (TVP38/TMEM64 family)